MAADIGHEHPANAGGEQGSCILGHALIKAGDSGMICLKQSLSPPVEGSV